MRVIYIAMGVNGLKMDRKEAIDLALRLFRKDLDKNDVVKTLMESNIPESTAYRYAKKALDQYEWEEYKPDDKTVKNLELNALNTIYRSMKWAETNNEPELAVKYANLYITNKKRLKKWISEPSLIYMMSR